MVYGCSIASLELARVLLVGLLWVFCPCELRLLEAWGEVKHGMFLALLWSHRFRARALHIELIYNVSTNTLNHTRTHSLRYASVRNVAFLEHLTVHPG